ncbi:MAG: peptidylprolyl isomerase [Myxococcales bacterium]|nr:peptidylprolyl isomerase [Myxococcales bacterium]
MVAVINDAIVLDSELSVQLTPYEGDLEGIDDPKERARRRDKLRAQVLDEMIAEELIVSAASEARLEEITPKEVDQIIRETKDDNKLDDATFQQALAAQGVTLAQYRTNVRRQLTRLRAMKMLVAPKVNVSDEEVRAQYDQMVRRSEAVSQVRLAHIQLALPARATDAEVAAARAKAADIITRVKAGEEFGKLAAEFSDDANSKTSGGELGWIERGTLEPAWEQVVFAMEPKEVRGPVAGPNGLEVFYVTETKRTEMKPFDKMKDQIKGELQQRGMQKQTTQWIEELRKKAYIEVKL